MADSFYPSIDISALESFIINTDKIEHNSKIKVGDTTVFVEKGQQAIHKRIIVMRELQQDEICFEIATAIALRLKFLGNLLRWYEENRNWKDGAYIEKI